MASIEGIARASRTNLSSSLMVTHNLTLASQSPADLLMLRMNNVLRTVIDTNFDCDLDAVAALYATIGEQQPAMMDTTSNLALVNLSRSFAVVMEETIRRNGGGKNNNTANNNNNNNPSEWNNNNVSAPKDSWQLPVAGSIAYGRPPQCAAPGGGYGTWGAAVIATPAHQQQQQPQKGPEGPKPLMGFGVYKPAPAPTPSIKFAGFGGVPKTEAEKSALAASLARAARAEKEAKKDYSPKAIEGRITVFKVPTTVSEKELRAHCATIGPIDEFSYPFEKDGKHKGFALIKYLDNTTADLAVSSLNGSKFAGAQLSVERAKYWFKREERSGSVGASSNQSLVSDPQKAAAAPFAVRAPESAEDSDADEDEDEEDEDLIDNVFPKEDEEDEEQSEYASDA